MKIKTHAFTMISAMMFFSCTSDTIFESFQETEENTFFTRSISISNDTTDEIIPLQGDSVLMRKRFNAKKYANASSSTREELTQLDQIPIYLQIKGNTSSKQFLNTIGEGRELTFEDFRSNDLSQQFYLKILPATSGIPYLIYSRKTNTPISIGSYSSNPDVKVVYAKNASSTSLFGASWDIYSGVYSTASFVIENEDYPRQGSSGNFYDIYYSVITANNSKVSLEKYSRSPRQEFSIIPVEDFTVESVTFNTDVSTLSETPNTVFSDRFTNNGPIDQSHTFAITDSYKETSSYSKRTSYNINVSTKVKVKVPFIADGEITTSVSEGQDFTYGESEEKTISINRSYPIIVPAHYTAQMTLTLKKYTMNVDYCAVCVGSISGRRINIRGTWTGVDVQESDAVLNLTPIDSQNSIKKSFVITEEMLSKCNSFIKVE